MEAIEKLSTVNTDNGTGPSAVIKYNPITKSSELRNHLILIKWGDLITILLPWKVPNHRISEALTSISSSCLHTEAAWRPLLHEKGFKIFESQPYLATA